MKDEKQQDRGREIVFENVDFIFNFFIITIRFRKNHTLH